MLPPNSVGAYALYPYSEELYVQGARLSRFGDPYHLFYVNGDQLWVPRAMAPLGGEDLRDDGLDISCENNFKPRNEEQQRIVSRGTQLALDGESFVIQAPTGSGKTIFGTTIAANLKKRTLVITTKEDLFKNWIDAAKLVMNLKPEEIGIWRADKAPSLKHKFVVGLVQSILKGPDRYPVHCFTGFGLVICDEVHRMGAEEFSKAMWWLPAKIRLGLSATPTRKDGKEQVFLNHIGPVKVVGQLETLIPRVIMKTTTWTVPRVWRNGQKVPMPHSPGKLGGIIKNMAVNVVRNRLMANFIKQAYDKGRATIFFSSSIEHLQQMWMHCADVGIKLDDMGYYTGLDSGLYTGSKIEREAEREKSKVKPVILATYQMCSEGTDIPWLDTCVLGSPRSDVEQIVGRIRREFDGKKTPVVFDPVDVASPVFRNFAKKRLRWYQKLGCEVVQM